MVREIAVFGTREGQAEAFVETYGRIASIPTQAEDSRDASLHRGVEDPASFTLIAERDPVDVHTALAQRPEFGGFGEAIGPHLAGEPEVRHVEAVA